MPELSETQWLKNLLEQRLGVADLRQQWRAEHLHILLLHPHLEREQNWLAIAQDIAVGLVGVRQLSLWHQKECLVTLSWNPYLLIKPGSALLTTDLPAPPEDVVEAVRTFSELNIEQRRAALPALALIGGVRRITQPTEPLPPWLANLQSLPLETKRAIAVWISRYGLDETATLAALAPPKPEPTPEAALTPIPETTASSLAILLANQLRQQGFSVESQETAQGLYLRFPAETKAQAAKKATQTTLNALTWPDAPDVRLYGLAPDNTIAWRATVADQSHAETVAYDRFSFNNPQVNLLTLPIACLIALFLNFFLGILMMPWHIWVHEFGHATVAWAAGYRALPLPFGWTNVSANRHMWVYFGILFLLILFFRQGWQERRPWVMTAASVIAVIQFYCTWLMSDYWADMWISFGGVGGEFYLSTFLIISFYFRLPDSWRWDFWRFVVIVLATATLLHSFWQWHLIDVGLGSIPWGSMLFGQGDANGDMNRLVQYGWTPDQIIATYRRLGETCLLTVAGVYSLFVLKSSPKYWQGLKNRIGF